NGSSTSKNNTNNATSNKTNSNKTSNTTSEVNDEVTIADLTTVTDSKINLANATTNLLIDKAGTYTFTGDTNKTVVVDTDGDVSLVLDKANFTSEKLPSIYVRNAVSTKIELKNTSTITNNGNDEILNAAVYVRSPLSLTGSGTLTVTDKNGHGIKAKDDMTSKNVTLNISAQEDGIHASDSLTIESGKYTITSGDDGIQANDNLIIKNGTFVIDAEGDGLHGDGDVELSNGTYTINAKSEGIESKANLLITNGTYTINATDDGLNAASSLTIKNGKLTIVSAQNDGIDSNGALTIEGGTVYATGLNNPEGAFDVDNTAFTIKGGTVVGLSASATKPTEVAQNTIM
ncbi:MAG: carbohydrate-binding domain-containing protein, partial [Allobaculum sp.]|nr:carbohydrate-binding domain-containing protein [Allobaculum sp.]